MTATVTILGCGSSVGVPTVGGNWGQCDPDNPHNRRLRSSILIESGATTILFDTSPDLRQQMLRTGTQDIAAVLYSHVHADHVHGIDDLRGFCFLNRKSIPVYGFPEVTESLTTRFPYLFRGPKDGSKPPFLTAHTVEAGPLALGGLSFTLLEQDHTVCRTLGFRLGNFAYTPDVKNLSDAVFDQLQGVETWVVSCIRREPHIAHAHLETILQWIDKVGPQRAYLTHMNNSMDYATLCAELPDHIRPAHDGLKLTVAL